MNYRTINPTSNGVQRVYVICEFRFSDFDVQTQKTIIRDAEALASNANNGAANSGDVRDQMTKLNDAYAGILAEFATLDFLNQIIPNSATRPAVNNTANQIDLLWNYLGHSLTLEVRSSFVNKGLRFGLFNVERCTQKTYFDVLGPYYQQSYKTQYEPPKDAYVRVLFEGRKYDVKNRFITKDEPFYLIGFMDGQKLINMNYHKPLTKNSTFTKHGSLTGDYYVAPINLISDIAKVLSNIQSNAANPFL
ncbi:hypothetical protein [Lactococcus lactis]|uniref:hypothetical protein n=1 Tax=Lactococcus lactis TaxID=1358 RepID=UPI0018AB5961|nr:hypothetical protein [Lactococcus lactis]